MSVWSKYVVEMEREFGSVWRRYHVAAQLGRLASGVVGSVLWTVLHGSVHDWTGLVPVVSGALWATLAQVFPQVPWLLVRSRFGSGPDKAPGGAGTPGAGPAEPPPVVTG